MADHRNHTIDYLEFPATDIARTKRFYADAFGWSFTDYGDDYTSFEDGVTSGGFTTDSVVAPDGVLVVLYADDLDAAMGAVRDAGGEIVRDVFDFPGGKRFHFRDPNGNQLAVWSE